MEQHKRLGEIFVEKGIITDKTVERVLALSGLTGKRFGTLLEEMSLITGEELAAALAVQYGFRTATRLADHFYPPELLKLVPCEVAMCNAIFPLRIDGGRLAMAMADPTETKIVSNIAADNGLAIVPVIASRKDIYEAISRHYFGAAPSPEERNTVLVVDDNNLECRLMADILTPKDYRVITAADGMEGFKMAITEKPQVIITDTVMPKLDGYGLFDALQNVAETRFIPVILVTAISDVYEEERAFEKGFYDFILKPVREITLATRVKRAFYFYEHHYRLV